MKFRKPARMACPLQTADLLRPQAACKPTSLVVAVGKRKVSGKSIVGAPSYVNNYAVLVSCVPSRSFGQRRSAERLLRSVNGNKWTGSRQAELAKLAVPLRPPTAQTSESAITANGGLDARVNLIMRRLREDLPRQYVVEMDWSVYSPQVVFVDPVTHLRVRAIRICFPNFLPAFTAYQKQSHAMRAAFLSLQQSVAPSIEFGLSFPKE